MTPHPPAAAAPTGEPTAAAAGLTVHQAIASLEAAGDHDRAAAMWREHLVIVARDTRPRTVVVATAPFAWDGRVRRLGARRAVEDLVDAFDDAEDGR